MIACFVVERWIGPELCADESFEPRGDLVLRLEVEAFFCCGAHLDLDEGIGVLVMEATIGDDAGMDASSGEFIKRLDDSTTIQVLQLLHKVSDIANASCVCRSWRRCGPCRKFFPSNITLVYEVVSSAIAFQPVGLERAAADDVQTFAVCAKLHLL